MSNEELINKLSTGNAKAHVACMLVVNRPGGAAILQCAHDMLPSMRGSTLANYFYNDCNRDAKSFMQAIVNMCLQ